MKHSELVDKVSTELKCSKAQAAKTVNTVFAVIAEDLVYGSGKVSMGIIGTLKTVDKAARAGRNPATGASIAIAARRGLRLTATSAMKERLK